MNYFTKQDHSSSKTVITGVTVIWRSVKRVYRSSKMYKFTKLTE